jgi:hypothetical protein
MIGSIRVRVSAIATLLSTALAAAAPADMVQIQCSRDNTLIESPTGEYSGGAMVWFFAGQTKQEEGQRKRRALLYFDIDADIPLGSAITSATLRLRMSKSTWAGTNPFTLHRVLADWAEGTTDGFGGSGQPSVVGSSTWIHRVAPDLLWNTTGGDFAATASATTQVSGIANYTWTSAQLTADVQGWLDAPWSNFGWLFRGNEAPVPTSTSTAKRFDSREGPASTRPLLTVVFTPPAVFGACCFDDSCVQASPAACAAVQGVYRGDGVGCEASTCTPPACPPDITGNGVVDVADLLAVIINWGPCPNPPSMCPADIIVNGAVDVADLLAVITAWGACPL